MDNKRKKYIWSRVGAVLGAMVLLSFCLFIAVGGKGGYGGQDRRELDRIEQQKPVSLISSGKTLWRYLDEGQDDLEAMDNWKKNKFDTSGWKEAAGSFGAREGERREMGKGKAPNNLLVQYGEDGSSKPVFLFRTEISIANPDSILSLSGEIEFDDAALIYINGDLVWAGNNPDGGYEKLTDYGAKEPVSSPRAEAFIITDSSVLKKGKNTIAVEIHQNYSSGSDIYFDFLSLVGLNRKTEEEAPDTAGLILEVGDDEGSVRVNWYTQEKGTYAVQYSSNVKEQKKAGYASTLMGRQDGGTGGMYCYSAELSPLKADTAYTYRISRVGSKVVSDSYVYRTPPGEEEFTFLFAGDPQVGHDEVERDSMRWEEALEQGIRQAPHAAFLISAGDQADSTEEAAAKEEFLGFRRPELLKTLPVAVNHGNHEADSELYEKQFKRKGEDGLEYSFTYRGVLFVSIDTLSGDYEAQADFLRKAVKDFPAKWVVVTMHYSLFSAGAHADDEKILRQRNFYAPVFSECGVDLVLAGHDHSYTRTFYMKGKVPSKREKGKKKEGETLYVTGGSSTGNKFYDKNTSTLDYAAFFLDEKIPVITAVSVGEDTMRLRTFDAVSGREKDSCTIMK